MKTEIYLVEHTGEIVAPQIRHYIGGPEDFLREVDRIRQRSRNNRARGWQLEANGEITDAQKLWGRTVCFGVHEPSAFNPGPVRIQNHVITGRSLPRHLGIAYGRHILRLLHGGRNCGLWLRDLPLSLHDLGREYGINEPYREYLRECQRAGVVPEI